MTKTQVATDTITLFKVFMAPDAPEKVAEVLQSGYIGQGEEVEQFERSFASFLGLSQRPLSVNSCTSAITLALRLCGVGPKDLVVSTPMTCTATNLPILNAGARILWADVDEHGLIDPDSARKLCMSHKGHVKAVMAVDWGGRLCDYDYLKYCGVPIIADCAHHITGEGGDYRCFSFQAIKHLTTGDGGALITPFEKHNRAKLLRWYGFDREGSADFRCAQDVAPENAGYKFHMNDISASIGRANLQHLEGILQAHRNNAKMLSHLIYNPRVVLPPVDCFSTDWWVFTVKTKIGRREDFMQHMKEHGVSVSQVHRRNDHLSCFKEFQTNLPGLDDFSQRMCCLPCGWWLSPNDVDRIADVVNGWR